MAKIKRKLKYDNLLILLLFVFFISLFLYSTYNIIIHYIDDKNTLKQTKIIDKMVKFDNKNNKHNEEIIEQKITPPKANPYWDYIKMNLIDVDFSKLKTINKDVKGWIKVNGTNINYPFVQTSNNHFYLNHSFDKSHNSAGWVFLDYRNNISNLNNKNTIIYAHGRLDKTMFGSLKNILSSGWLKNKNNYVIMLSTEYENSLWQIFSLYHIPTTSDYIKTDFHSNEEYHDFTKMLTNRSFHNFNTIVNNNDRILTLSTCYNNFERMVVHAKLIKKEKK